MPSKRKAEPASESDSDASDDYEVVAADAPVDISSALIGGLADDDDNDDLEELLKTAQDKRNLKDGKEALKRVMKGQSKQGAGVTGGGSFQSMGLHPSLLKSLLVRGYRTPTPIQRASIPALLATPPRDLVGMARTGSGKTLAYMIPLIQRLGGRHATTFGIRALVLVPARELALQVLKVGKELARGWSGGGGDHAGDNEVEDSGKGQGLKWGLVVGGESLDEQFEVITSNPDVLIATPGRLLHLAVEMNLDLRSVQYVVFDEADRLFEMGFSTALSEILHRLPPTRQTLLFSATLPKSLVEFAKAGLDNPKLVRLDAESKISSDLRMAFFAVKQAEKDAALLTLLRDVIQVPLGSSNPKGLEDDEDDDAEELGKKRKRKPKRINPNTAAAPHQTLIFVATKHHVEYLLALLTATGYSVSHIYSSLDQSARSLQMSRFRSGATSILLVTDVAARGIDIPVLENVVNYDFPHGARVFVHRVGRTARAGRKGWAWSFISREELPLLLDLQLFLGRPLLPGSAKVGQDESAYIESLILGTLPRDTVDIQVESIVQLSSSNSASSSSLPVLKEVMKRGQGMYERSMGKASQASYTRSKEMLRDTAKWGLWSGGAGEAAALHPVCSLRGVESSSYPLLLPSSSTSSSMTKAGPSSDVTAARNALIRAVDSFRPNETVFEVSSKGKQRAKSKGNPTDVAGPVDVAALMKDRRKTLEKVQKKNAHVTAPTTVLADDQLNGMEETINEPVEIEMAGEDEIEDAFGLSNKRQKKKDYRDAEFFMSHHQKDAATEKGYSLRDGASFAEQASHAAFDLTTDEGGALGRQRHGSQLTWDRKHKKFVKGGGEGADNVKMVKTESGARLPASYRSGRFEEWKEKNKVSLPRVGEEESERAKRGGAGAGAGGKRWKHNSTVEAKALDPKHIGYERKLRTLQKKKASGEGGEGGEGSAGGARKVQSNGRPVPAAKGKGKGKFGGANIGKVKSELKSADQIRKARALQQRRKEKNARPSRKGKR